MADCPAIAVIGDDRYPCRSHEGGIPAHHFAAHWPPCEAPWCKLLPGHRGLHDIPPGRAQIFGDLNVPADPVAAFLDDARKRWDVWGEAESLPVLVAALEAVLKLADEWNDMAAVECPDISLREAISRELLAKEDTDAR